jgi:hypothetical protein
VIDNPVSGQRVRIRCAAVTIPLAFEGLAADGDQTATTCSTTVTESGSTSSFTGSETNAVRNTPAVAQNRISEPAQLYRCVDALAPLRDTADFGSSSVLVNGGKASLRMGWLGE